jgi:hypothetical protein
MGSAHPADPRELGLAVFSFLWDGKSNRIDFSPNPQPQPFHCPAVRLGQPFDVFNKGGGGRLERRLATIYWIKHESTYENSL